MSNLPLVWTKHLKTKEEKTNFERLLRGSTTVNTRLQTILHEMAQVSKGTDYDSPSWAYRQADQNGYNRALSDLLKLFDFMENK
jgi:hypothetical protein